jgi:hypothetical protein
MSTQLKHIAEELTNGEAVQWIKKIFFWLKLIKVEGKDSHINPPEKRKGSE